MVRTSRNLYSGSYDADVRGDSFSKSDTWKKSSSNLKRSRDMILKPGVCCEKYFSQKYESIVGLHTSPMFSSRPTKALISSLEVGSHFLAFANAFIVSWCSDTYLSAYRLVSYAKTSNRSLPPATASKPSHN